MARSTKEVELKREYLEGQLACLGTAQMLVDLVSLRVGSAIDYTGQARMLAPVIDDLGRVKKLLSRTQALIKDCNPSVFGGE